MKKLSMLILVLAFMLAGCNSETKTLKVFNWGVYMDASLIDEFEDISLLINYRKALFCGSTSKV